MMALTKLALYLALLFPARAQECSFASCNECLEQNGNSCFWQPEGGCATDCPIQDASCFSIDTFPDLNAAETCQAADEQAADASLCNQQMDCEDCIATTLSDGTSTCQWFKDGEYCGSACDMTGCGELTCDDDATDASSCDGLSCTDCLETEGCGSWQPEGGCAAECLIADASCFTTDTFPNLDIQETCEAAANQAADATLCAEKMTCADCTSTSLSDGNSTCQWFPDGYCASACDQTGCGDLACVSNDVCFLPDCESCLTTPNCTWQPAGGCAPTCMIQDTFCYTMDTFPDKNASETCQAASDQTEDANLCASNMDCADCTSTTLSDGNTTCQWFADGNYCGSGCDMNGCGGTECTSNDECLLGTCEECLNAPDCAWVPEEGCLTSCNIIADTECFPSTDYNASDVCTEGGVGNSDPPGSAPPPEMTSRGAIMSIGVAATILAMTIAIITALQ